MDYTKYMAVAIEQAERALEEGNFPVGCVIVYDGEIVASGQRVNSAGSSLNEIDHGEIVALRELSGSGNKIPHEEAVLFCTLEPCLMCYAAIILSGIRKIVFAYEDVMGGGTVCDLSGLPPLYKNAEMEIIPGVLREKSLSLFVDFFNRPDNKYWKNSLLEKYTLTTS